MNIPIREASKGGDVPVEKVIIPEPRSLPESVLAAAGADSTFTDRATRIRHARGQSLLDLLALREGQLDSAPDAVVVASSAAQIEAILSAAARAGVAVIPYGGGTSVTGGVSPPTDSTGPVISLDTVGLTGCVIDPISRKARLAAGLRGPEAERALNRSGFTLGHFPQSWEFATIGGFAATKSAGQASNGYGRFDEMVLGLNLVTPAGTIATPEVSHSAEGPSILDMVLGSEGTLGVITEVEAAVRPIPDSLYEVWVLPDFESGVEQVRTMAQRGPLPAVVRLSDEEETRLNLSASGPDGMAGSALKGYLRLRDRDQGVILVLGYEGSMPGIRSEKDETSRLLRRTGGIRLGARPGRAWSRSRFHGPYLREGLLDLGLVVETFETAAPWSRYRESYLGIAKTTREALGRAGMEGVVLCHLSHAYADAASLYFTIVASPGPDGPAESWLAVKNAALATIGDLGLPISHHHGVGRDHREEFASRLGRTGVEALSGLRDALDPDGIMNPGCLLPQGARHIP